MPEKVDAPAPGSSLRSSRVWTLVVIGCQVEGVTLDKALIIVPPGGDLDEAVRIAGEAGIPHPYLQAGWPLGIDFDATDCELDEMHPYVG
jgi:hypothetical protein